MLEIYYIALEKMRQIHVNTGPFQLPTYFHLSDELHFDKHLIMGNIFSTQWKKLQTVNHYIRFHNIYPFNAKHFLIVTTIKDKHSGIYFYNLSSQQLHLIKSYPKEWTRDQHSSTTIRQTCFNKSQNKLYFVNDFFDRVERNHTYSIYEFNIQSMSFSKHDIDDHFLDATPKSILSIKDDLHVIMDDNHVNAYKHIIYDTIDMKVRQIKSGMLSDYASNRDWYLMGMESVYISSQQRILMICSYQHIGSLYDMGIEYNFDIWSYSLISDEWNRIKKKIQLENSNFCISDVLLTMDEKYLILMANNPFQSNDIFCMDIHNGKYESRKSKVTLPNVRVTRHEGFVCKFALMTSSNSDVVVYGYVRTTCDGNYVPYDVTSIIIEYCAEEMLHYVAQQKDSEMIVPCVVSVPKETNHWVTPVSAILFGSA